MPNYNMRNLAKIRDFVYKRVVVFFSVLDKYIPVRNLLVWFARFNDWLFSQGTRVVEFMNAALLIGFTVPFMYNIEIMLSSPVYNKFNFTNSTLWFVAMVGLGLLQVIAMTKRGVHANQVSGYLMIISGWVWGLVTSMFVASSPPLTTAPVVYGVFAFVCTVAGLYLIKHNKRIEDLINRGD